MRDNRIKSLNLADGGDWAGDNIFSATLVRSITSKSINGEILSVESKFDRTGSIALSISGTGEEFFRRNAPSGTAWSVSQPRLFSQSTTGSIANAEHVPFIVNGPVILNAGSMASGTLPLNVTIKYR